MQRFLAPGFLAIAVAAAVFALAQSTPSAAQMTVTAMAPAAQLQPQVNAVFQSPAADLRMRMHSAMSEHTALAGLVTQKAATSAPDFEASLGAINKNSNTIADMIGELYGPDARAQFLPMWNSHIQGYLDYTLAAGANDQARKDQVRQGLAQWVNAQADLFASVNPNLSRDTVAGELNTHVTGTLAAIDTFAAREYPRHYEVVDQAFMHSYQIGDVLARGIVQQFPERFAQ